MKEIKKLQESEAFHRSMARKQIHEIQELETKLNSAEERIKILEEALQRSELCTSEAINGLARGFIGEAQIDLSYAQKYKREVLEKSKKIGEGVDE